MSRGWSSDVHERNVINNNIRGTFVRRAENRSNVMCPYASKESFRRIILLSPLRHWFVDNDDRLHIVENVVYEYATKYADTKPWENKSVTSFWRVIHSVQGTVGGDAQYHNPVIKSHEYNTVRPMLTFDVGRGLSREQRDDEQTAARRHLVHVHTQNVRAQTENDTGSVDALRAAYTVRHHVVIVESGGGFQRNWRCHNGHHRTRPQSLLNAVEL